VGLRNPFRGVTDSDGGFEVRPQLAVPDEVDRLGIMGNSAADEAGNLFEQAAIEHRNDFNAHQYISNGQGGNAVA